MAKKFMFQFIDYNDKTEVETVKNYYFDFINITNEDLQAKYNALMDDSSNYEEFVSEMEEFGAHDFFGDEETLHGFESAEIEPKYYHTVVTRWQRYFEKILKVKTGPIYITDGVNG